MPNSLATTIQYFHDCYRSDNRELFIPDFLGKKVEHLVCIEGKDDLLTNLYPKVSINSTKASSILKKLQIFKKEKELLLGCFFVCGTYTNFKGVAKRLCSPLFYYPAEITEKDGFHYVSINSHERRINYPLVSLLSQEKEEDIISDTTFKKLPEGHIRFGDISKIVNLFKKHFPKVDLESIYSYPENTPLKDLKKISADLFQDKDQPLKLIPTSLLGLVDKSANTRGVLNELKELTTTTDFSLPLSYLLSDNSLEKKPFLDQNGNIPSILSEAQEALVKSAAVNPITLIVGPPGTGKTYTICATAIEHMNRGESVLIASKNNEAVDVIISELSKQIGRSRSIIRGGKKRAYATPLRQFLKGLITRVNYLTHLLKEFDVKEKIDEETLNKMTKELTKRINTTKKDLTTIESHFLREVSNEISWGKSLISPSDSIWEKLKISYIKFRNNFQTPLWEFSNSLYEKDHQQLIDINTTIKFKAIQRMLVVLRNNWNDIKTFREFLKLSNDTQKVALLDQIDFKALLKAFPIWSTSLSDAKDLVPLKKELFDLLIIDESTQCDIASCLPLIQRAKRVVFAGDPNQLRHISFLSKAMQSSFVNKYKLQKTPASLLNYRDNSILDVVMNRIQSADQIALLDEHFRSITPIISFSNKEIYASQLKVMRSKPDEKEQGLYFIPCEGVREKNGTNKKEAEVLLSNIKSVIDEEYDLSSDLCTSIGVLSPFRDQVELLSKLVLAKFSLAEIEKHQIKIGTAYSFQGAERDHMHLSFAVDVNTHHSAFIHLNKPDVFNVSITRARNKQYIYHSVAKEDLKADSLLRKYLSTSIIPQKTKKEQLYDSFAQEVIQELEKIKDYHYWPCYPIAGITIDLLVKYHNRYIGIDLIGYPGELENAFGIERYRILSRADIHIFPLPLSDWKFEPEKTKQALKDFITQNKMVSIE